jgi:diadenylate cyclase
MEIMHLFLPLILITLVIIFQPEIRRWLKYLARLKLFFVGPGELDPEDLAKDITQIVIAIRELANDKYGALIVIEPPETEHDYLSPGTQINADISSNLILSIFIPKSPLHDGAIIIQKDKIKAAGVILPITDNRKLSHIYGTRHRAALGLTEILDCMCIVVSEESGSVSIAYHGKLLPCQKGDELTDYLSQFYTQLQITTQFVSADAIDQLTNVHLHKIQPKLNSNDNSQPDDSLPQAADVS